MGPFIHDGGPMLKDEASSSQLVKEIESLVSARGLKVVEATTSVHQGSAAMTVVLFREDEEINTDDLAASYNLIYPRYSIILGERDLQLEVSSPGLQRSFKDVMEFSVFKGKDVIYLADRYYGSAEIISHLECIDYHYIIRGKSNFYKKQVALMKSDDEWIEVEIDEKWRRRFRFSPEAMELRENNPVMKIRVIKRRIE